MKRIFLAIGLLTVLADLCNGQQRISGYINTSSVSHEYFGNDSKWYMDNIPFFECSDQKITEVYYYRWKLYKAHIRDIGKKGYIITEFLNPMGWDLKPYNSLNDATGFHIDEGRWLKDNRYAGSYINYMYQHGGNNRHFSEAIADASYTYYLVNNDKEFILSQLPSMVKIYTAWMDHYDQSKGLYYIEPLLDATEYTISSIDATGGKDGFTGGDVFRPTINSYMYADALAIKNIALLKNDTATARVFTDYAIAIKNRVQRSLWNDQLKHFTDRYKANNSYVNYWDFIRGRELAGYIPWTYNLPDDNADYSAAWQHLLLPGNGLRGKYGLRTTEPSYEYYMKQYRFDKATGLRECQWNGPSWPFQTTQVLLGMANLINNYHEHSVTVNDYYNVLKQYTMQHFMPGGEMNLMEDYDPDKGGAIVNLPQRSEHYNHSGYNDLIITGLCGLRPVAGDSLVINPLISPDSISYFCLQDLSYHGHNISIVYDRSGEKYERGAGLSVDVDGRRVISNSALKRNVIKLAAGTVKHQEEDVNLAINLSGKGYPIATASYTDSLVKPWMAIDGRLWYFNDVINYWTSKGSDNATDWFQIAFEKPQKIHKAALYFYDDGKALSSPRNYRLMYWDEHMWQYIKAVKKGPVKPLPNGENIVSFNSVSTDKIRVFFTVPGNGKYTAVAEMKLY